jgi:hypothetical protein
MFWRDISAGFVGFHCFIVLTYVMYMRQQSLLGQDLPFKVTFASWIFMVNRDEWQALVLSESAGKVMVVTTQKYPRDILQVFRG